MLLIALLRHLRCSRHIRLKGLDVLILFGTRRWTQAANKAAATSLVYSLTEKILASAMRVTLRLSVGFTTWSQLSLQDG